MFSGCPSVRPLSVNIYFCAPIYMYTVETFQWNLADIFIPWVGIAEKVLKVRGQRSRSQQDPMQFCDGGIYLMAWRQDWFTLVFVANCLLILSLVAHSLSSFCCAISWRLVISGHAVHFSTFTTPLMHVCISHRIYAKRRITSWGSWRQLPCGKVNDRYYTN